MAPDEFAKLVIERLKAAGDTRAANYDESDFCLLFEEDGKQSGSLNLVNLHAEFVVLEPEHHEKRISEIVRAALSHLKPIPEEFKDASYDLRPRLWARTTFEQIKLDARLNGDDEPNWPIEPIGSHLFLTLVFDMPESVRSLSQEELDDWGISFWEAREVAVMNLGEEDFTFASLGDILYASNSGDTYDATRIVLKDLIDRFEVDGFPVAMVPNRDNLLVTGSDSEVGIKMMIELAATELKESPRPLGVNPLIYKDGQWQDWKIPSDHPSYRDFRRCQLGMLQFDYDNQKKILEQINEQELIEEFVATFTVASKDDALSSYSVWGHGVKTSLPKTDSIAFINGIGEGVAVMAEWDEVVAVCGHLMREQKYYPPRFKVEEYPSPEILAELQDRRSV